MFKKASNQKTILTSIKEHSRKAIIVIAVFSFFTNLLMLTVPIYMLQVYDRILTSYSKETLLFLTIIAIIALIIFGCIDIARSRVMIVLGNWFDDHVSPSAIAQAIEHTLLGSNYTITSLRDISAIRSFLLSPSIFSLFDAPWTPIYIIVIFLLHPYLGLISVFGAIILFTIAILNEIKTRKQLKEANQNAMSNQQYIEISAKNAEAIQAMGMMPSIINRWMNNNTKTSELQTIASKKAGTLVSFSKVFRLSLQVAILGVGALLVIYGQLTPGAMIAASILLSRALAPVEQSIGLWKQLTSSRYAYQRLKEFFEKAVVRTEGISLPAPEGKIDVENIIFFIPNTQEMLIKNISLTIPAGESLAIIGPSGAGKSTLARLIIGALKPSRGVVRLDGADIYHWKRHELGDHIGYLPQDVELLPGTIKENIARLKTIDDEAVIAAAQMANVHEMILKFPKGYETEVGLNQFNLSPGQRQRIALARALYKDPQLIILDEPNASLDNEGELALTKTLIKLRELKRTIIVITHKMNILKIMHNIIMLKDGQIQFAGDSKQFIEKLKQVSKLPASHYATGANSNGSTSS